MENMSITIYTRHGCPYCTKIKQVFEGKAYPYTEKKLVTDFSRDEFYNKFGQGATFPQVVYNGKHTGGCTETVRYLRENNLI